MKLALSVLSTVLAVMLCAFSAIGVDQAQQKVEPPEQSLGDDLKMQIDRETAREWNADDPPHRMEVVSDVPMSETAEASKPVEDGGSEDVAAESCEQLVDDGYSDDWGYSEAYSGSYGVRGNPDGLNSFDGTYDYNGHHETYYASRAVYDDQLTVDDDGFFRDSEGRYVVASSDYEKGDIIQISQGEAIVMDIGPASGTVDVHTTWGR